MKLRIIKEVGLNNPSKYAAKNSFRGATDVKVTIVKSNGCEVEEYDDDREELEEAEYQGRKVTLNKPMRGDVKKSKVYVKNKKGNVVKVNFGDPNMKIKKSDPEARKSFRARHNCADKMKKADKTTPGYWSCKAW